MSDESGGQRNKKKTKTETVVAHKYRIKKLGNTEAREHETGSWRAKQDTVRHQTKTTTRFA